MFYLRTPDGKLSSVSAILQQGPCALVTFLNFLYRFRNPVLEKMFIYFIQLHLLKILSFFL